MQKQNIEEKIVLYREALEDVVKQLTAKRTELSSLSKTTIDQYNLEIPKLRDQIAGLQGYLKELEVTIDNKKKDLAALNQDLKGKYEALEASLKAEYKSKFDDLSSKQKQAEAVKSEYEAKNSLFTDRETKLVAGEHKLLQDVNKLNSDRVEFEVQKNNALTEIEEMKSLAKAGTNVLEQQKKDFEVYVLTVNNELNERQSNIEAMRDSAIAKNSAADEKLAEAVQREANAFAVEEKNRKRAEELNQLNIKLLAQTKSNNKRTDELNEKEQALNERDANIKLAEANMSGG